MKNQIESVEHLIDIISTMTPAQKQAMSILCGNVGNNCISKVHGDPLISINEMVNRYNPESGDPYDLPTMMKTGVIYFDN